jgi:hypothetical protein
LAVLYVLAINREIAVCLAALSGEKQDALDGRGESRAA